MRPSLAQRIPGIESGRLVPFLAVLLEVLRSYPWLVWISTWPLVGWDKPPLSLGGAVALALVAEGLTRFALRREWPMGRVRLVVLPVVVVLLASLVRIEQGGGYAPWDPAWGRYALGNLPALAGGLAFGVFLLWRGISVGRESPAFDYVYRKFLGGLVALVALVVVWGTMSGSIAIRQVLSNAGVYVVAFFAVGLLALALANLQAIQEQMRRHQEAPAWFQRRWLSLVVGLVLVIVAASLGLASAFSMDMAALLLRPLQVLADWLLIAFIYGVAYPLGFVVAGLIYFLRFLIGLIRREQPPQPFQLPDFSDLRLAAEGQGHGLRPEVVLALKLGLVALVVGLVLYLLARAIFRYWKGKPEEDVEEVSESLWSGEAFKNDLRSLLAWLFHWFKGRKHALAVPVAPPAAIAEGVAPDRLFSVRELYQGLLWEGRRSGLPRHGSETPYEYGGKLRERVGPGASDLHAITEAYVMERYGDSPVAGEALAQLNRLWRRLRSFLQRDGEGQPLPVRLHHPHRRG